ncbi:MAG: DUF5103 domain-containing protein [Prevotella sp.]|nr:DUF5103 domain-containing protein [Prevotella sp.]
MKRLLLSLLVILAAAVSATAGHRILSPDVKSLQVVVNQDWMSMPVMRLGSTDVLNIGFDELSHNYHRFIVHLEHCEADWTPTQGLFESDWLQGFNDQPIEDYENSLNTTVLFSHYRYHIPNNMQRLKMSGNYRLHVLDEDNDREEVLVAEFRVLEQLVNVGLGVTTNTDISHNTSHQQVNMTVNYNQIRVTNLDEEIQTFVLQNGREDNMKENVRPNFINQNGLKWEHNRGLIFEAGNEYHKFEVLDPNHSTMGLARTYWDQDEERYHAVPFQCEPQRNYLYNEDADGAFYIRNSDNIENDRVSDYVYVHYKLKPARNYAPAQVFIEGKWTTEEPGNYVMEYDEDDQSYNAVVLQKMGYYNYQLLMRDPDGLTHRVPEEGSFFQTENRYQALVYYRRTGQRSWRLVGYQEVCIK